MPSQSEADKAVFCDQLYALNEETDSGESAHEEQAVPENIKQPKPSSAELQCQNSSRKLEFEAHRSSIHRAATHPTTTLHQLNFTEISTAVSVEDPTIQGTASQSPKRDKIELRRTLSAPSSALGPSHAKMNKSALGKRKRKRKEAALKFMPEARQIFKQFTFFFIPNDDIAPLRRARIRKAQEYGATWSSVLDGEVTHIITDKGLSYQDVIRFLKIPCIPPKITIVVDTYPVDCIQFRAILDPTQGRYQVKGNILTTVKGPAKFVSSQESSNSLDIKPAQSKPIKWDYAPPQTTPPRSEEMTQEDASLEISFRQSDKPASKSETTKKPREDDGLEELQSKSIPGIIRQEITTDELDEMIKEARILEHLPLDEYEDDRSSSSGFVEATNDSGDDSDSPSPMKKPPPFKKTVNKGTSRDEHFSCMRGGTTKTSSVDSSPNARTISVLQEMADYYTRIKDTWRPIAYRRAISTLRRQPAKIVSAKEACKLPFVGQRLALKIEEIAKTDCLRRLENAKAEPSDHILQKFMGIYGVGFNQANKWLQSGYSTLDDLKTNINLSENQLLGIEHYDDLQTRIPRDEVTALGAIVTSAATTIDPEVQIIIGGSYRRGAATSGDIDCIITKPNTSSSKTLLPFLQKFIFHLETQSFLVAALAVPHAESGSKWHGCCVLPDTPKPIWRRIDFLLVPASELGAALLYFTGNDIFNRSIRLLASRKGMRLNQRGLYKNVLRGPGRVKLSEGELIEGRDERRIFDALGVPWRRPEERIC